MSKLPVDPRRAHMLELVQAIADHTTELREYASVPGNAWLAKGELGTLQQLLSELETVLEEIKQDDAESGL